MPSPYKTNCFDYTKIGCKSRKYCVDRCNVEWAKEHCDGKTLLNKLGDTKIYYRKKKQFTEITKI